MDKLWVRNTLNEEYFGFRHPHRMTPIMFKGLIIQGNAIDGIGAFDEKTGNLKWFLSVKGGVEAGGVVEKNTLYFGGGDGFFYSIDAFGGQLNWKTPINAETLSTPTFHNENIYFIGGNNRVYSLQASTGKVNWSYSRQETSNLSIRGGSQPEIYKETLYLGFSDGALVALSVDDGKVKWEKNINRNRRFRDIDAKPVIENDKIYVAGFDDAFYCLDANSGSVIWTYDRGGFSAATLSGELIYFTTTDGYVVALQKSSGKLKWQYKLKKGLGTQPTLYRGLVVFGEYEGDLVALESLSGNQVGRYSPGRGIMSQPTIDKSTGRTYFISVNANLYALKIHWQANKESWPWDKAL
ncbi:MAG: PQQ-binding-like beta-propeller repeat protein [Bdellovibrionales bacterium]|nr:PQQ-binding-like beta-propeller repeat protein [Bdellovibrionales bacterium]